MALFQLHLAESPAEPAEFALGQVRVTGIGMFRSKSTCQINQRIVPKCLVKYRSAATLQHPKQLRIDMRILDHVVQDAKADDKIEELIRISKRSGIHLCELGNKPISPRRSIRGLDSGLRQVESPDLCAIPAQI